MTPSLPSLVVSNWTVAVAPDVLAAAAAFAYVTAVRRVGGWSLHRTLSFLAGLGAILVALQSGIAKFDDRLLSVHMVQHMLLLMVAPPLLLAGQTALLALRAAPARRRPARARALSGTRRWIRPPIALAGFYVVLAGTHLPSLYDAALRHPALHELEHLLYLGAGLLVWWPIIDGDPVAGRRLGGLGRLAYVLAVMPAMAILGAYLNRAPSVAYPAYGTAAHALGISALDDQAEAGAIMWVAGGVIVSAIGLWTATSALLAEENRQRARDRRVVQA